ncbi:DUF4190 domain-containing protein [Streptomyces sp. NPDC050418]|uniref:DUF4190 domain-containing protein n=1 Tax=Streptomyces sp. NPDC050418 TaxID=3365612 RepID=UPI0037A82D8B
MTTPPPPGPESPWAPPPASGPAPHQAPPVPGSPYPMAPPPGPYMMQPRNGLGIAGLVLGIIGTVLFLTIWVGIVLGILALIFGLIGRGRAKRGEATNGGVALAGAILGGIALLASSVWLVFAVLIVSDAVDKVNDEITQVEKGDKSSSDDSSSGSDSGSDDAGSGDSAGSDDAAAFGDSYKYDDGVVVTVSKPVSYTPDQYAAGHEKGNKAFQFTITIENGGKEKLDISGALPSLRDGEGADAEMVFDGSNGTKPFNGSVLPGKKATAKYAFSVPAGAEKDLQLELTPAILDYEEAFWAGAAK